jgi:tetratricopeptide (TPR) repeat protein
MNAFRFAEALKISQALTDRPDASADDWLSRGWTALSAGDAEDAVKAFRKALELDPDARIPAAARPEKKGK